jgi:NAD(P)-dependent dehydrogenase (short-subunit alcohol dehydrogenase family)
MMTRPAPLFDRTDRVVIVTGAARGLGRALTRGLAAQGALVVACDIDTDGVRATADAVSTAGGTVAALPVDVADAGACAAVVRHALSTFGRIDVLVNDAAIDIVEPFEVIADESWRRVLDIDLSGVMHMSRPVARAMIERGKGGSIINISSIASAVAIPALGAYGAAKGGVNQLTRVMAIDLARHGIRVNAIAPGYLENVMEGLASEHAKPETEERIRSRTALGRRARLEELLGPVVFLASDAASYVTGAILFVDGGYTAA